MTTSSRKPPSREGQNALLGDLESIRSLLEPVTAKSAVNPEPIEEDIPTLDDIVEGEEPSAPRVSADKEPSAPRVSADKEPSAPRVSADKEPSAPRVSAGKEPSAPRVSAHTELSASRVSGDKEPSAPRVAPTGLADDAFDALLGDEWRDAADRILEDARARLDERAGQWSTDDANDFMEALQQRLNGVVHGWLAEVVRRELEDLRETLTAAIGLEIDAFSMRKKDESLDENEGDAE